MKTLTVTLAPPGSSEYATTCPAGMCRKNTVEPMLSEPMSPACKMYSRPGRPEVTIGGTSRPVK